MSRREGAGGGCCLARSAGRGAGRGASGRILIHAVLLLTAAAFLFPFAWMVLTAAKTDEEVAAGRWLPRWPEVRLASPYETTDAAGNPKTASLELLDVQVRTLDARVHRVIAGPQIAGAWAVESGTATLVPSAGSTAVRYRFDTDRRPLVLRYDFDFPADPVELHKLIVSLQPDDSWHRVDVRLDLAGTTWRSTRSSPLAQHRALSLIFQPPTFDDRTDRPRIWIPLRGEPSAAPSAGPRAATLRLVVTPVSRLQAGWEKVTRNYVRTFDAIPFWRYTLNSVILVVLGVFGTLFSTTFVAYAFARLRWPGRSAAFVLLLATMMLPAQVTMIPTFLIWRELGWYNTLNPLWVPSFFGSAFFIFMMVQHMRTIPRELEEAARIDGLGHVQTWYYVILPQVKPAAAAVAVMTFMGAWNDFLGPLIYLRDQSRFPLSLGLFAAQIENTGDWTMIMAGNVLMTVPVIVVFFLCQRYFVQGLTASGLK